jgi:hypothetical protein
MSLDPFALSKRVWFSVPERIRDAFWPATIWTTQEAIEEELKRKRRQEWEHAIIDAAEWRSDEELQQAVAKCKEILDSERARGANVEQRLTGFLTLSSIGAAAGFIGLLQQSLGNLEKPRIYMRALYIVAMLLTLYIVVQVVCASLAAVRGLKRRPYLEPSADGLLPYPGENKSSLTRRQMREYLSAASDHYANNSTKVEEMAIVHVALRNLILGIMILLPVLVLEFFFAPKRSIETELIRQFGTDSKVRELFRGPVGERGPQGPVGPQGPIGLQGTAGPPGLSGSQKEHCHRR